MKEELQKKLVDGILDIFKTAATAQKDVEPEKTEAEKLAEKAAADAKVEKDAADKAAADKVAADAKTAPVGVTAEQMMEGFSKMGENIVTAVKEMTKTPAQRSEENKTVAVKAVKDYLTAEGFDLNGQAIEINFSETKKSGGVVDGGGLELKLVKDGKELNASKTDETGENQYSSVEDIPEDVQKSANKAIWREMLLKKKQ